MKRTFVAAGLLALLCVQLAPAETVYLRNKPYKGPTAGAGKSTQVDFKAFAEAMGLAVSQVNGAWVAGSAPTGQPEAGQVYVNGKKLENVTVSGDSAMVSLFEAAEAAGARASLNKELGSIDVNLVAKNTSVADAGSAVKAPANVNAGPIAPKTINKPGAAVQIEQHLVPGKTNIVVFGAEW